MKKTVRTAKAPDSTDTAITMQDEDNSSEFAIENADIPDDLDTDVVVGTSDQNLIVDENGQTADSSAGTAIIPLGSEGSLESYIRTINRLPMLAAEDERSLINRLREYGDVDAARKLVLSHLRLVVSISRSYLGFGLPLADLIQEGTIGLMKAVEHFDPNVGGRLAAFAIHWIKSAILDYVIKNWRVVKVATTKAQRKLFFKLRQNKKHLGWLTEQERLLVADHLGVTSKDVAEMETRLAGQDVAFDVDPDDGGTDHQTTFAPAAYLEDENSNFALHVEEKDYKSYELKRLREAMEQLDDRSRMVIKHRWLDENKATLQELSQDLGVSLERVRQIENAALKKIRNYIAPEADSAKTAIEDQPGKKSKAAASVKHRALTTKS